MLLSIVVPVYNERHTLATVLGVVARKEIIVVDDYSKDGTREWLKVNFPDRLLRAIRYALARFVSSSLLNGLR